MLRKSSIVLCLIIVFSSLGVKSANAVADGPVACGGGGTFTIANNNVVSRQDCVGVVNIPEGVLSINDDVFIGNADITTVRIPSSLTSIGAGAFAMSGVQNVIFSANSSLTTIGAGAVAEEGAFESASRLESITIPASVQTIGRNAFLGATSLQTIYFLGQAPMVEGINPFTRVKDGATAYVTPSNSSSFVLSNEKWYGLNVGTWETINCSISGTFTYVDVVVASSDSCNGVAAIPSNITSIGESAFEDATLLTSVTFTADSKLVSIGTRAFRSTALNSITIPMGVTTIGELAFAGTSLTSITIPANVSAIGVSAFTRTDSLDSVTFAPGSKLTSIGNLAFSRSKLTSINIPAGVTSMGDFTFTSSLISSVTFAPGSKLTSIGSYAFVQSSLASITIPATVASIGEGAFSGTKSLTSVTFAPGSKLTSIGRAAFLSSTVTSINIPSGVTSIGDSAFRGASRLTSINIPSGVTSIEESTFFNTLALTSVSFANGSRLTSIGKDAFLRASALTSITIPASVTSIGEYAFSGASSLTSVTFGPSSKLSSIGIYAFYEASALTSITIPASVTAIEERAFENNSVLNAVFFLSNVAPSIGLNAFHAVAAGGKAYVKADATGYGNPGAPLNGLTVEVGVYTVNFNTKGGSSIGAGSFVRQGSIPAPTAPTRAGHTFAGWSLTNTTSTDAGTTIRFPYTPSPSADVTFFAKWTKNAKAVARVKPTITGTVKVSKTLTASKGTWNGSPTPKISYQWYVCTKQVKAASQSIPKTCKAVSKATKSTLAVTKTYKGKYLTVRVTGTSAGTSATHWLAKSTSKVK